MLLVTSSPHIRSRESVQRILLDVIIGHLYQQPSEVPTLFGINALKLILISGCICCIFEAIIQKAFKRPVTINDFSAIITGILIVFNLPASAPWWLPHYGFRCHNCSKTILAA